MRRVHRVPTWTESAAVQLTAVCLLLLLAAVLVIPPPSPAPPHVIVMPLHLAAPEEAVATATGDVL